MEVILSRGKEIIVAGSILPAPPRGALSGLRQLDGYKCPACGGEAKGLSGYEGKIAHFMWRCIKCRLEFRSREENLKDCIWENPLREFEDKAFRTLCSGYLEYKAKLFLPDGK